MKYPNQIKTVSGTFECKLKEKKSVFTAQIFPIKDTKEAEEFIKSVKKNFYNASHHCYAFKLTDGTEKNSDSGEPSGTAGIKIKNAIEHFEMNNVLIVIIRFFGGIKLGTGPLGKAYYNAAVKVIEKSKIEIKYLYQIVKIKSEFEYSNLVYQILSGYGSKIINSSFKTQAEFDCLVIPENLDKIRSELVEKSGGKVKYKAFSEYLYI